MKKYCLLLLIIISNYLYATETASNENSIFRIKSTFVYDIKIENGFAIINLKRASFRNKENVNKSYISYLKISTAYNTKGNKWNIDLNSNKKELNKYIYGKETIIIENEMFYIPIGSIQTTINNHWLTFTVGVSEEKNKSLGTCYTHNKKKLTEYIKNN